MALESPPNLIDVVRALREQGLTQQQIATKIGTEQPYVSKLLLISGLDASIVTKWKASWMTAVRVPLNEMRDLHPLSPGEQREMYDTLLAKAERTKAQQRSRRSRPRVRR